MKRFLCILLIMLSLLPAISGCATGSMSEKSTNDIMPETAQSNTNNEPVPSNRKVIRNASLDMVAENVTAAYDALLEFTVSKGGYEVRRNQRQNNGYLYIDAQIRITPDKLDDFIAYAEEITNVINTQINTEDITKQYFDAQTRLNTMETSLKRYYDYLQQAKTIEESLAVQAQINQLTLEIESLKGSLSLWDNQLSESTINISLRQLDDPIKIKKKINWSMLSLSDTGYLMSAGFKSIINIIIGIIQWLLIAVVACSPLLIIALIILIIIRKKKKKKNR